MFLLKVPSGMLPLKHHSCTCDAGEGEVPDRALLLPAHPPPPPPSSLLPSPGSLPEPVEEVEVGEVGGRHRLEAGGGAAEETRAAFGEGRGADFFFF